MVFISAGHNLRGLNTKEDPGAVSKSGVKENEIAIEFRDLVCKELDSLGVKYIKDRNDERLADYLKRIQTGSGSVVIEFHCDSAVDSRATGCTGIIGSDADRLDWAFSKEVNKAFFETLRLKDRGVITESQSHRGRLGLMREQGIVSLQEMFFISNPGDLSNYHTYKKILAVKVARIIKNYEDLIK